MKLCNRCGETCALGDDLDINGLIDAKIQGGYSSTPGNGAGALDDCTEYTFSLCEFCLDWLWQQCKVPPIVYNRLGYEQEPFIPAAQRVLDDDWRTQKSGFFDEYKRRMEAAKNR